MTGEATDRSDLQKMQIGEATDLVALKRLAEKAHTRGGWEVDFVDHPYPAKGDSPAGSYREWRIRTEWVHPQAKGKVAVVGLASGLDGPSVWLHEDDATFIAAANPATILSLATLIEAQAAEIENLTGLLTDLTSWFTTPKPAAWIIAAGEQGADDAVDAARAFLASRTERADG